MALTDMEIAVNAQKPTDLNNCDISDLFSWYSIQHLSHIPIKDLTIVARRLLPLFPCPECGYSQCFYHDGITNISNIIRCKPNRNARECGIRLSTLKTLLFLQLPSSMDVFHERYIHIPPKSRLEINAIKLTLPPTDNIPPPEGFQTINYRSWALSHKQPGTVAPVVQDGDELTFTQDSCTTQITAEDMESDEETFMDDIPTTGKHNDSFIPQTPPRAPSIPNIEFAAPAIISPVPTTQPEVTCEQPQSPETDFEQATQPTTTQPSFPRKRMLIHTPHKQPAFEDEHIFKSKNDVYRMLEKCFQFLINDEADSAKKEALTKAKHHLSDAVSHTTKPPTTLHQAQTKDSFAEVLKKNRKVKKTTPKKTPNPKPKPKPTPAATIANKFKKLTGDSEEEREKLAAQMLARGPPRSAAKRLPHNPFEINNKELSTQMEQYTSLRFNGTLKHSTTQLQAIIKEGMKISDPKALIISCPSKSTTWINCAVADAPKITKFLTKYSTLTVAEDAETFFRKLSQLNADSHINRIGLLISLNKFTFAQKCTLAKEIPLTLQEKLREKANLHSQSRKRN